MGPINHSAVLSVISKDVARHEADIEGLQEEVVSIRVDMAALKARMGIYAALGAAIGSALVTAVIAVVVN